MFHAQPSQPSAAPQASPPPLPDFAKMTPAEMLAWLESPDAPATAEGHANPQIRRLVELGADRKAERLADCGNFMLRRCPSGHTFIAARLNCGLTFCSRCLPRIVHDIYSRWQATLEAYEHDYPAAQFTLLDISQPLPRNRELAIDMLNRAKDIPAAGPTWAYLAGYDHDALRLRVLVIGRQRSLTEWQSLWPAAFIKTSVFPVYELRNVFLGQLLKVELPRSLADRAEQEVLFARCHRFRTRGIRQLVVKHEIEYISVVGGKDSTTEMSHAKRSMHCPHCAQLATERSQWFPPGHARPTPEQIRWRYERR